VSFFSDVLLEKDFIVTIPLMEDEPDVGSDPDYEVDSSSNFSSSSSRDNVSDDGEYQPLSFIKLLDDSWLKSIGQGRDLRASNRVENTHRQLLEVPRKKSRNTVL